MTSFLPTLRQLAYLEALDDHRHFGRASEAMAVSQSTLSSGIAELEKLLGVTLVERSRRGVHFTPLGEAVVVRARELIRGADEIAALVQSHGAPMTGELRLAVIPTIAPFLLPPLIRRLKAEWPKLRLHVREETSAQACEALHRGQTDCVLLALPYPCGEVEARTLFDDPLHIALPATHPLAAEAEVEGSDLDPSRLLLLEDGHCLKDHALSQCGAISARGQQAAAMLGTSLHTLVEMVDGGMGATFVPEMAVRAGIAEGREVVIRPIHATGGRPAARRIALAWRKGSPRVRDFELLGDAVRAAAGAAPVNPCGEGRSGDSRSR